MRRLIKALCCAAVAFGLSAHSALGAEIGSGIQDDGRRYWRLDAQRLVIELTQLQPDQVRAFFIARGFTAEQIEPLAATCVFQMTVHNRQSADKGPIQLPLAGWRIATPAEMRSPVLTEAWDELWAAHDVPMPARLAFRWALFPVAQTFHHGDRNWGMFASGLAVGARFDLTLRWVQDGREAAAMVRAVQCAQTG